MTETKRFFWPRAERKLSFHVENHVLDSLLAICFHSSQKNGICGFKLLFSANLPGVNGLVQNGEGL